MNWQLITSLGVAGLGLVMLLGPYLRSGMRLAITAAVGGIRRLWSETAGNRRQIGWGLLVLGACGVAALSGIGGGHDPPASDAVGKAFVTYEKLWRQAAIDAAGRIEREELTTDVQVREFLAEAGKAARRTAFETIAAAEQEKLDPWDPAIHAAILRGYGK